jgi:hypothetical protein
VNRFKVSLGLGIRSLIYSKLDQSYKNGSILLKSWFKEFDLISKIKISYAISDKLHLLVQPSLSSTRVSKIHAFLIQDRQFYLIKFGVKYNF